MCLGMRGKINAGRGRWGFAEVQLLSIVCSTVSKGGQPRLRNTQNFGAVPP